MKLEQQVTSLELSKKLNELGVPQNSLFYWAEYRRWESENNKMVEKDSVWELDRNGAVCGNGHSTGRNYSALTVAELGELLPKGFYTMQGEISEEKGNVWVGIDQNKRILSRNWLLMTSKTEADIRAKMLIYLIENKLLRP